jgi:hypothetical protein
MTEDLRPRAPGTGGGAELRNSRTVQRLPSLWVHLSINQVGVSNSACIKSLWVTDRAACLPLRRCVAMERPIFPGRGRVDRKGAASRRDPPARYTDPRRKNVC